MPVISFVWTGWDTLEGSTPGFNYLPDLEVTLTGAGGAGASVAWAVTGNGANPANGADFVGGVLPSGVLTFAPGETSKKINIFLLGDTVFEPSEQFVVTLSNPVGATLGTAALQVTVRDDDTSTSPLPVLSSQQVVSQMEGNSGLTTPFTFTFTRTGDLSGASSATYSVLGDGNSPATASDFSGGVLPSGTIQFSTGQATATVTVNVLADTTVEDAEQFRVQLSNPVGAVIGNVNSLATIGNDDTNAPPRIKFAAADIQGKSGLEGAFASSGVTFVLTRTGSLTGVSSVNYSVVGSGGDPGQQASGADFVGGVLPSGVLTFAAGESSKSITIAVANDVLIERDENFIVMLSNPVNADLDGFVGLATILNDDVAQPTVAFATTSASVMENAAAGGFDFVVNRTGDISGVSAVLYEVTGSGANPATAADFVGGRLPLNSVSFAAGETSKVIHIGVVNDDVKEADETFTISLVAANGAVIGSASKASAVIGNDDAGPTTIGFTTGWADAPEGAGGVSYVITRTGDLSGVSTVAWRAEGSGPLEARANAADFGGVNPAGIVTFAAGETTKTVFVPFANDSIVELDELFSLYLSNPTGAVLGSETSIGSIHNDDVASGSTLSISVLTPSRPEGEAEMNPFDFVVTRSGDTSGSASVDYRVAGSGASPTDMADLFAGMSVAGHVDFAAGETSKTVTVYIRGDRMSEANETFSVTLSNATGASLGIASATATVLNDDTSTLPMISIPRYNLGMPEGWTFTGYVIHRSGDLSAGSTVQYAVTPGAGDTPSASAADFEGGVLPSGMVTFAPGQSSATIYFTSFDDAEAEASESFKLILFNPSGATLGDAVAFGQINNSDEPGTVLPPSIGFSTPSASGAEGGAGLTYTVVRTGYTGAVSSVAYSVAGAGAGGGGPAAASDFAGGVLPGGVVTFAAGETSKTIHIAFANDADVEQDEGFVLSLINPVGAGLGLSVATGTILNDDTSSEPSGPSGPSGPSTPGEGDPQPVQRLSNAYEAILRSAVSGADASWIADDLAAKVSAGQMTAAQAIAAIIPKADATTSVASLSYQFFTGSTPTRAGFDYLVSPDGANPNNLNSAYYQSFSLENRYINFAVNLGKLGAGRADFESQYGQKDLFDATKAAYATIFGAAPSDAKVHALLDASFSLNGVTMTRAEYFAYYGQDGARGIGTKAAMVGWLLAEAEKADLGAYAKSNAAFLAGLTDGDAYGVDIIGVYGRADYAFLG